MLAVILSTQFSFGRMFAHATEGSRDVSALGVGWIRGWLEKRRKEAARREVIAKHTKKGAPAAAARTPDDQDVVPARPMRAAKAIDDDIDAARTGQIGRAHV